MRTLEIKQLNEVNWILYAPKALYSKWRQVSKKWMDGSIAGPDGVVYDKPRPASSFAASLFKCFEGDIPEENMMLLLQQVLDGKALLKKNTDCKSELPSLTDLAMVVKFMQALRGRIMGYLIEQFPDNFAKTDTWEEFV